MGADIQSPWLNPDASTTAVFLVDANTPEEAAILRDWIDSTHADGGHQERLEIAIGRHRRRDEPAAQQQLAEILQDEDLSPYFIPLRVLWLPKTRQGESRVRLTDLVLGDPRSPPRWRQRWLRKFLPERYQTIAADGAASPDLVQRYDHHTEGGDDDDATATFILRQARLALERAERRVRGARYKVPRLVVDSVLEKPRFISDLKRAATASGMQYLEARQVAQDCLREMAADHSTLVLDMMVGVSRFLYRRGFDAQIDYLAADFTRVRELSQHHTVVFLMTHKSYLDGCVMASLVYELDLPPLHLFGGMNMNFPGAGGFARRAGTIFIRRSFGEDHIYKLVMRHYIEYLIDKRFPLNWAFEGTRSRTGKLMPPRYGLLRYVADAAVHARQSRVMLVPVSISYDQLPDVDDLIAEQRGARKQKESYGWLRRYIDALSRPYGRIHVRFGQEIPVLEDMAEARELSELELQKRAFAVAVEANRVTPITATSLITFALMGQGDRAMTIRELTYDLKALSAYVRALGFPLTGEFAGSSAGQLDDVLRSLARNGVLNAYHEGVEPVFAIAGSARSAAAYYRNTSVHFFVIGAIAELALLATAEEGGANLMQVFQNHASKIRDLFKFDFFFPDKADFDRQLGDAMRAHGRLGSCAFR